MVKNGSGEFLGTVLAPVELFFSIPERKKAPEKTLGSLEELSLRGLRNLLRKFLRRVAPSITQKNSR